MPTIHNPTVTTFHLRPVDKTKAAEARDRGESPKPMSRKVIPPQGSVQVTEDELAALLEEPSWQRRLEKVGDGQMRVRSHLGVAGSFDQRIRDYRRQKARAEQEQARATENVEALKKRIEALESQTTAESKGQAASVSASSDRQPSDGGGGAKGSGRKG